MSFFCYRQWRGTTLNAESENTPEAGASHATSAAGGEQSKLQVTALMACLLLSTVSPYGAAQQTAAPQVSPPAGMADLPPAPTPNYTEPLYMRSSPRDFTRPQTHFPNPILPYKATTVERPQVSNSPRLGDLIHDGKIYLSLSDAITLALENNYDIAISRYNLDIADTDILRARAGSTLRGVNTGVVSGTLGGGGQTLTSGGGPGGTSVGPGGAGAGTSGIVLATTGGGPLPAQLDPTLTGTVQYERSDVQQPTTLFTGTNFLSTTNTEYNFAYNQGFLTGTALNVSFNNTRSTTNSVFNNFSPEYQSSFRAQVTQHLLQGFGWGLNSRFIVEAKNDRRITDSSFRQQILYTVNQIENIYWGLVSAYEDVQAKERALEQSKQLTADNRKQLEIGTLAPLDVVNSDSQVASDQQALISSQSNLEYQQLIMKQAVARNLSDPTLTKAPVIPSDRVSLLETPEEKMPVDDLVKQAYANRPDVEQDILSLKNNEITLKALRNGLLPTVDAYAFYGASALGGNQNPNLNCGDFLNFAPCPPGKVPGIGYGTVFQNLFNSSSPDKGVGVNITIPIRNRTAQADQARSMLEYRQAQMRLEQVYTQIRMQVINGQFALTNDRAQVQASLAAREYAFQSLDSERKKYHLGASTTAAVLQQQRNLAIAENNLISAKAAYGRDRASFSQILANTLDRYGISLGDAVSGKVAQIPVISGLEPSQNTKEPNMPVPPAQQ